MFNKWRPALEFSKDSFKDLFGFGSKLLISGLMDTIYNNIYFLIIGKYYSAVQLGQYTRAEQFNSIFSSAADKFLLASTNSYVLSESF